MMYFTAGDIENFAVGPIPLVCVMQGVCMFVYSVLDNSDGKQARKIKASSPLGLLFDHGCDVINTGIASITLTKIVRLGNGWSFVLVLFSTLAQFYYATLEE